MTGNKVSDISVVDSLSSCLKLRSLFLTRNPFEKVPNYRKIVSTMIPNLEFLDGKKVENVVDSKVSNAMILEAASSIRLMEEELDDEMRLEAYIINDTSIPVEKRQFESSPRMKNYKTPLLSTSSTSYSSSNSSSYNNSNIIPDTGSELTHGSSVVLAGNMAAAMRRRRNKSTEKDDAGGEDDGREYVESALDIIDSAAKGNTALLESDSSKKQQSYFFTQFFKEGDISSSAMSEEQIQLVKKKTNATLQAIDTAFSEDEKNSEHEHAGGRKRLPSESPSTQTRPSTGVLSARTRSASIRAAGGPPSTSRQEKSNTSFDLPWEADNSRSSKESLPRSGSAQRRPKSAGSSGRRGDISPFSPGKKGVTSAQATSPRQMNSSRPQSAVSSHDSSFSLPFRVAANDEEMEMMRTMSRKAGFTGPILNGSPAASIPSRGYAETSDVPASIVHIDIVKRSSSTEGNVAKSLTAKSQSSGSNGFKGVAMVASDEMEEEEELLIGRSANIGGTKKLFQINRLQKIVDCDSDSDSEDIAITHAARHQLMSSSSQPSPRGTTIGARRSSRPLFLPPRNKAVSTPVDSEAADISKRPAPLVMPFAGREAPANESERAEQDTFREGEGSQPNTGRLSSRLQPNIDPLESDRSLRGSTTSSHSYASKPTEKFLHTVSSMVRKYL